MNLDAALRAVTSGDTLSPAQAEGAMDDIMDGTASPLQVAALLGALRMRGETIDEVTGFARSMQSRMVRVQTKTSKLVDTCGTGGDSPRHALSTFNVSTAASFVAAGAGATVAKHGNRAMSSKCGSADVLEALGINLKLRPDEIARCIDEIGIGFMFAPLHHPAMKNVGPIRTELRIRTVFNLLGPLVNPAGARHQVMGVSDARWIEPIAEVLLALGSEHAIVAHSHDGLDEFSTCAATDYIEVKQGQLRPGCLHPDDLDCLCTEPRLLKGGDAGENAEIIQRLLRDGSGAPADIACLNAAAILVAADLATDFEDGLRQARESVRSGRARNVLNRLTRFSNDLRPSADSTVQP